MKGLLKTITAAFFLLIYLTSYAFDNQTRVAFFYGSPVPFDELHAFNVVVINPPYGIDVKNYNNTVSELYAYVSIGELDADAPYAKQVNQAWKRGKNPTWNSEVMDLANDAWLNFLLEQVFTPLWQQGYRGFFLDTLDSYQLLKLSPQQNKNQLAGLIKLIKAIKAKYPTARIILNRGFEIIDSVHQDVDAIAVESLFNQWDNNKKIYGPVPENQRIELLKILNQIKQRYRLPIIVIDYVDPSQTQKAREIAKKIADLGFIPYVSDAYLTTLGIGLVEVIPRKILILYNGKVDESTQMSAAYSLSAIVLQHMGYIPIQQHVDDALPDYDLKSTYAGIIAWFNTSLIKKHQLLEMWLTKQVQQKIPVVFMENFGLPQKSPLLKSLNLHFQKSSYPPANIRITYKSKDIGYETLPKPNVLSFLPVTTSDGQVWLKLLASNQQTQDAVAITPWGGFALEPFNTVSFPNSESRWVINPFNFFRQALRLPLIPVPDTTTETGKRILTVHIDGDAFISRVPWQDNKYTGDLIYDEILKKYQLPTTVSFIQREFELISHDPILSNHLIKVAQKIYDLPWVQLATHTYSHPLQWGPLIEGQLNTKYLSYPDKNYYFNYEKEIVGSADFINTHLAPANKKVRAVFWSGDGNVQEKPLQLTYQNHLKNINGMSKIYLRSKPSITNVTPFGLYKGKYFQVFAPIANEFQYTDNWSKPLYAFQQVIHMFEATEKPVRYSPISIYYHFYSAADQAAFRALKRIYEWTIKQDTTPLPVLDYIDKVIDFNKLVISKTLDNTFLITNNFYLREFRWPVKNGFPNLDTSVNVVGFNRVNNYYYIHLGPAPQTLLQFSDKLSVRPYLSEANAQVTRWQADRLITYFKLNGYVPLKFTLANMKGCQLFMNESNGFNYQLIKPLQLEQFNIKGLNHATFEIRCHNQ